MGMLFDPSEYDSLPAYRKTAAITRAIETRFARRIERGAVILLTEVPNDTGVLFTRRIDVWVQFLWECDRYRRIAYEVKVSRADFFNEMRHPEKRQFALSVSNEYYFATPPGLVQLHELPEEAGLVEVGPDGAFKIRRQPRWRETPPPKWSFIAALTRRAARLPEPTGER